MAGKKAAQRKHIDGTACPEGTARLPRKFDACCDAFTARTRACYFDVRYEWWASQRSWFTVIVPEAGGGGIGMAYCPHCGAKLGGVRRIGRYMDV